MAAPVKVAVVLAMFVTPEEKSEVVDLSHLTTEPVCPLRVRSAGAVPAQIVGTADTDPPTVVGLTVMVKFCGVPLQETPFNVFTGVTVMVALMAVVPVFVAVNAAMLPVPLAARPMAVLLLVQV